MTKNICTCGRVARVVIGLFLMSMVFWGPKSLWFLLGAIPVIVGVIGYCPFLDWIKKDACSSCCCKAKRKE